MKVRVVRHLCSVYLAVCLCIVFVGCSVTPTAPIDVTDESVRQGRSPRNEGAESCLSININRGSAVAGMMGGPEYPGVDSMGEPITNALWRGQKFISFRVMSAEAANLFSLEEQPILHVANHTVISQTAVWRRPYVEEIFPCESKNIVCGYQGIPPSGHYAVCAVKAYCYYLGKTKDNPYLSFAATGNDVDIVDMSNCKSK